MRILAKKTIPILLVIASLLTGCNSLQDTPHSPTPTIQVETPIPPGFPWWNETVGYEIFVRSFYDSDGDGIGDFNGITEKLDYLNDGDPNTTTDLGISTIWLMPIFPSPSYHGYDVTDYYSVNPQYGTMEDFTQFIQEAHKRDIKVIIDLVLNHTSDQHPWFKEAKKDAASPYRDWYIWSDTDPGYNGPWNQDVWHPSSTGYYYGIFEAFMPDLNYNNPEVTAEMDKVTKFWLEEAGVDGFRLDAAKHLIENKRMQENTNATHDWFKDYRNFYKIINPNAITIGELFGNNLASVNSYTKGDQFDLAFNFELASAMVQSAQSGSALPVLGALKATNKILEPNQYSPFLTNHDQNRVMSTLEGNPNKAKVAASLLLTSPGMPFIYYGEEIGMEGIKPDENIRRPMQWSAAENGGFTTGNPWEAPDSKFKFINVEMQTNDPESLLSHYRNLIHLRNAYPALQTGDFQVVNTKNSNVFASLRTNDNESLIIVINMSSELINNYELSIIESNLRSGEKQIIPLMGVINQTALAINQSGGFSGFKPLDELPPYSSLILRLSTEE
jgi:alpha-amylase